ncbi:DUF1329 domain-containing protein [Variovorax sp. J22P271]|uniref:DUF1329 domain-containing protein n=1 Tax=Variovorax davisae TaxID=3053515 RepID=UPI002575BC4C|nr:DUF1329 domain-containing protein [Variovorax sp. J22P271]MDM0032413.1 DUF1329 domain-containing protein [Variovorax sp. J22P271]
MKIYRPSILLASLVCALAWGPAQAAVSNEEAAKLKSELTPLGAERAGNKDGSIPAWTGAPIPYANYKSGAKRPDPFAADKPLYTVTAKNMEQYADKLTDGTKALLKKFPDTYKLEVYPTRRTAAAPQWVYDNTFKNATTAKIEADKPVGAFGGIPFPIPQSGAEVMSNHLLRWRGGAIKTGVRAYQTTAAGQRVLIGESVTDEQMPYYFQGSPAEFEKQNDYWTLRILTSGPPLRAGEAIAGRENVDGDKTQVWVYLPGQRRVRKLPNACCDTPSPPTAGLMNFDETFVFIGRLDRTDFKILGKKEILIPYNTNAVQTAASDDEVLGKNHMNPEKLRWELHRVWLVEAAVRAGQRHVTPKSLYYVDEDSWYAVLADRWDAKGQLWKTIFQLPFAAPDMPGVASNTFGYYDLLSGSWFVQGLMTEAPIQYQLVPRYKDSTFTPDALAGEGVR